MKIERQKNWLFIHIFSPLVLHFGTNPRDFWWGTDDPWDKDEVVKFRFLKMYASAFVGVFLKQTIILIFSILYYGSFYFILIANTALSIIVAFLVIIEDWYVFWKSTHNPH